MAMFPKVQQNNIQLSSLKWVIGQWSKIGNDETLEEHWYTILGDSMAGWFRWLKGESIFLYEFMLFQQIESKVVLKIKHFGKDLVGWEEKDKWTEYIAWESTPNRLLLQAKDPKHTPWMVYEKMDSKLLVTFFDLSGNKSDQYEFNQM